MPRNGQIGSTTAKRIMAEMVDAGMAENLDDAAIQLLDAGEVDEYTFSKIVSTATRRRLCGDSEV